MNNKHVKAVHHPEHKPHRRQPVPPSGSDTLVKLYLERKTGSIPVKQP